jgi:hypothetical protein
MEFPLIGSNQTMQYLGMPFCTFMGGLMSFVLLPLTAGLREK